MTNKEGELQVEDVLRMEDFVERNPVKLSLGNPPKRAYRNWYDSVELVDYVAEKCHREIEYGGYTF
jgi:hypothetical protein